MVADSFCRQLLTLTVFRIQVFGGLLLSTNKMPYLLQSSGSFCHFPTWISSCLTNLLGTKIPASRKSITVDTGTWIKLQGSRAKCKGVIWESAGCGKCKANKPFPSCRVCSCPFHTHVPVVSRPEAQG